MSQKITPGETLTETQERIFAYCREHPQATQAQVARALGLSRETVNRLMNDERFLARLDELHEAVLSDAADIASLAALGHVDELAKLLRADDERDRVRAAEMILVAAADAAERQVKTSAEREEQGRLLDAMERLMGKWRERGLAVTEEPEERLLSETERRVIEYKVQHPRATQAAIGAALGITREHVNRILSDEAVKAELRAITAAALGDADKATNVLTRDAVLTLDRIARDGNARSTVRLRAMKCLRRFAAEVQALRYEREKPLDFAKMHAETLTDYWDAMRALGHDVHAAVARLLGPQTDDDEEGPPDYAAAVERLSPAMREVLRNALMRDPERLRVVISPAVMAIVEPLLVEPS